MRRMLFLALFIFACAPLGFAQSDDDYNKVEFFGGFSHNQVETGANEFSADPSANEFDEFLDNRTGLNGFNASITGNVNRYVGLKFDVSGHYKSESATIDGVGLDGKFRFYNFLGGVQIKDNSKAKRFKPFAHALFGAARQSIEVNGLSGFTTIGGAPIFTSDNFEVSDTSFAMAIGGGIDVRVHPRVDLRLIQVDYNPVFEGDQQIFDTTINGRRQDNVRFSFGVVIH